MNLKLNHPNIKKNTEIKYKKIDRGGDKILTYPQTI